jgi:hypothetical protein
MQVTVKMSGQDLAVFAAAAKHPFTVAPDNETQLQVIKPTAPEHLKRIFRQRILAFVTAHPGASTSDIRKGVPGHLGFIHEELKAMRKDGTLRVWQTTPTGTPIRHYIAETIFGDREAA